MRHTRGSEPLSVLEKIAAIHEAETIGISAVARKIGVSRTTIHGWRRTVEKHGADALPSGSRRGVSLEANRLEPHVEAAAVELAMRRPGIGQDQAAAELRKTGVIVSATGVRGAWLRHGLATRSKRVAAAKAKILPSSSLADTPADVLVLAAEVRKLTEVVAEMRGEQAELMDRLRRQDSAQRGHAGHKAAVVARANTIRGVGGHGLLAQLFGPAFTARQIESSRSTEATTHTPRSTEPGGGHFLSDLFQMARSEADEVVPAMAHGESPDANGSTPAVGHS